MKTKITTVTVEEYDSTKNKRLEKEMQEDIRVFKEFIGTHRKQLKDHANERYPFKGIINFITVSVQFSNAGVCRSYEAVIYPAVDMLVPDKNDYFVESFSTNDIGDRRVGFKVFGPEKKRDL